MSAPRPSPALRHGAAAAGVAFLLLWLGLLPARLSVAMRTRGGTSLERATRALAGSVVDLSAVALVGAGVVLVAGGLLWLWQHRRGRGRVAHTPWLSLPVAVGLGLLALVQQEVKAERGAFPTLAEILSNGGNASFMEGVMGFVRYQRMWVPVAACGLLGVLVLGWWHRRTRREAPPATSSVLWGLVLGVASGVVGPQMAVAAQERLSPRLARGALSAPLEALVESSLDLAAGRPPPRPAELLAHWPTPPEDVARGAARLGWPEPGLPCRPHPHARALDGEAPSPAEPLLAALRNVSQHLFADGDGRVAVLLVSLESFRGADLHPLEPAAPRALTPVVSGLYEVAGRPGSGVLASRRMWQGGVRTAQGLAAMTCGLGTLPWNLAILRDVDAFPMRCAPDVLADSGFHGAFVYGSDAAYDGMAAFAQDHGLRQVISQDDLPPGTPRGTWGAATDFAVFDAAVRQVARGLQADGAPQQAVVLSLSNHSPFTPPEDAPADLGAQVERALAEAPNRATADDRRRLLTHAYTDRAVARLLASLDAQGIAERTLVVLAADHSTGTDYVWGPPGVDHETDLAKANIPFLVVVPRAFLARVGDTAALDGALAPAQAQLDALTLSQNDVPALLLALLSAHPGVRALPEPRRWHTLGGQVSSPHFASGGEGEQVMGINGVDEFYALDAAGHRVGPYQDAIFLQTLGDARRVTPRLIPIAAVVAQTLQAPRAAPAACASPP